MPAPETEQLGDAYYRSTEGKLQMNVETMTWPNWLPRVLWIRRACPRCNSVQFKPGELHSIDGLLGLFALRPVRCMFCWRRYYWFSIQGAE